VYIKKETCMLCGVKNYKMLSDSLELTTIVDESTNGVLGS